MRKLVWLVLAAFCAALGQAPALESTSQTGHACCHCRMPDCAPIPRAPEVLLANLTAPIGAQIVTRKKATRSLAFRFKSERDLVQRGSVARVTPATFGPVRLFAAHCAFLI